MLVQFDQRHRRSAGFGNVKFRTVADAERAVAMAAAAATEPEGGLVIDGAAVTVVPSQVKSYKYMWLISVVLVTVWVYVCAMLTGLSLAIRILLLVSEYSDNQ